MTKEIYRICKSLNVSRDRGFCDQIQRASVSVMSNIAEGFERGTKQEFLNYLFIAKGSAGEVRAQLYVALDAGYLNFETFKRLNSLTKECSGIITRLISSLKVSEFKGLQYKRVEKEDSYLKWFRENYPEDFKKYYNPETKQLEFWRRNKEP